MTMTSGKKKAETSTGVYSNPTSSSSSSNNPTATTASFEEMEQSLSPQAYTALVREFQGDEVVQENPSLFMWEETDDDDEEAPPPVARPRSNPSDGNKVDEDDEDHHHDDDDEATADRDVRIQGNYDEYDDDDVTEATDDDAGSNNRLAGSPPSPFKMMMMTFLMQQDQQQKDQLEHNVAKSQQEQVGLVRHESSTMSTAVKDQQRDPLVLADADADSNADASPDTDANINADASGDPTRQLLQVQGPLDEELFFDYQNHHPLSSSSHADHDTGPFHVLGSYSVVSSHSTGDDTLTTAPSLSHQTTTSATTIHTNTPGTATTDIAMTPTAVTMPSRTMVPLVRSKSMPESTMEQAPPGAAAVANISPSIKVHHGHDTTMDDANANTPPGTTSFLRSMSASTLLPVLVSPRVGSNSNHSSNNSSPNQKVVTSAATSLVATDTAMVPSQQSATGSAGLAKSPTGSPNHNINTSNSNRIANPSTTSTWKGRIASSFQSSSYSSSSASSSPSSASSSSSSDSSSSSGSGSGSESESSLSSHRQEQDPDDDDDDEDDASVQNRGDATPYLPMVSGSSSRSSDESNSSSSASSTTSGDDDDEHEATAYNNLPMDTTHSNSRNSSSSMEWNLQDHLSTLLLRHSATPSKETRRKLAETLARTSTRAISSTSLHRSLNPIQPQQQQQQSQQPQQETHEMSPPQLPDIRQQHDTSPRQVPPPVSSSSLSPLSVPQSPVTESESVPVSPIPETSIISQRTSFDNSKKNNTHKPIRSTMTVLCENNPNLGNDNLSSLFQQMTCDASNKDASVDVDNRKTVVSTKSVPAIASTRGLSSTGTVTSGGGGGGNNTGVSSGISLPTKANTKVLPSTTKRRRRIWYLSILISFIIVCIVVVTVTVRNSKDRHDVDKADGVVAPSTITPPTMSPTTTTAAAVITPAPSNTRIQTTGSPIVTTQPSFLRRPTLLPTLSPQICFQDDIELRAAVSIALDGQGGNSSSNSSNESADLHTHIRQMYGWPIGQWCVSKVRNFSNLFAYADKFNDDLSSWDVSNATSMAGMFAGAGRFNQSLLLWNTSNVMDMSGMFADATNYDQDMFAWNTSRVVYMQKMFDHAISFQRPLGNWDTSRVIDMNAMFRGAVRFDQDLQDWDTRHVMDMSSMYRDATQFNGNITTWNVSSVLNMNQMFYAAVNFNGTIGSWQPRMVSNFFFQFRGALSFQQDLCPWGAYVPSNARVSFMFSNATACPDESDPLLQQNPPGPFCFICH